MWDLALLILHVDIGTMQDEERAELSPSLLGCLVERSEVPAVSGIDWAVVLDQQGSHVHMLRGEKHVSRMLASKKWVPNLIPICYMYRKMHVL